MVFDVARIDDFAYACNRIACGIMALLRTCDGIFDFLPEIATVSGKVAVVVVEADFGIAGAFGFGAVCNRRDGVSASMLAHRIVKARAAGCVVVAGTEIPVFVRLPNHTEARVDCAVGNGFAVMSFDVEMVVAQAACKGKVADVVDSFSVMPASLFFGLLKAALKNTGDLIS